MFTPGQRFPGIHPFSGTEKCRSAKTAYIFAHLRGGLTWYNLGWVVRLYWRIKNKGVKSPTIVELLTVWTLDPSEYLPVPIYTKSTSANSKMGIKAYHLCFQNMIFFRNLKPGEKWRKSRGKTLVGLSYLTISPPPPNVTP